MASIENEPEWEPDLGQDYTQKNDPGSSLYVYSERVFIRLVKAALYNHDRWTWSENEEERNIEILSSVSPEQQDYLPQVRVRVGPISEFDGSIDNLKKWTKPLERHLYVNQAQVMITCMCELNTEAADLADHLRRILDMADADLGKRGILGVETPKQQPPQAARPGTEDDDVYEAILQSPFVILEREERRAAESDPILDSSIVSTKFIADEGDVEAGVFEPEAEDESQSRSMSVTEASGYYDRDEIYVEFEEKLGTYQMSGIYLHSHGSQYEPPVLRNSQDFHEAIIEIPSEIKKDAPVKITYDNSIGNVRDYDGKIVNEFGPVWVDWQD